MFVAILIHVCKSSESLTIVVVISSEKQYAYLNVPNAQASSRCLLSTGIKSTGTAIFESFAAVIHERLEHEKRTHP